MNKKTLNVIKKHIVSYGNLVSSNKALAIEALSKAGICDKNGNLVFPYK